MFCPECKVELMGGAKLGQGVSFCPGCKFTWHILKLRKQKDQRKQKGE